MLGAAIILPMTPPAALADAMSTGETPIWRAVKVCRLPNRTLEAVSEPLLAVPIHPIRVPKNG